MAKYCSFVRQIAFDLASESGAEALCVPRRVAVPIVRGRDTPSHSLAQGEATNETHPFRDGRHVREPLVEEPRSFAVQGPPPTLSARPCSARLNVAHSRGVGMLWVVRIAFLIPVCQQHQNPSGRTSTSSTRLVRNGARATTAMDARDNIWAFLCHVYFPQEWR